MADPKDQIATLVGTLYVEFMRLRKAKRYQDEYDAMGTLLNMLQTDREHLRKTHPIQP